MGNSGGGGLVSLYQSQAEKPTITATPAGDPPDLTSADLPPADGIICAMAHPGRAIVYTEWLDPAVIDESQPFQRERDLDMFDLVNGPPYSPEFVSRYRSAQVERNRRITRWVREQLDAISQLSEGAVNDLPFVVHGTAADPRFLDLTLDASDRSAGTLWGEARTANLIPATLGHHTSLRSWLSQWSVDESHANGPVHLGRVTVPVLVAYGTGDKAAFESHARALFDAVGHDRKRLRPIVGADHYFAGQPELLEEFCDVVVEWMLDNSLM
jgi:pimeloyl-ACP methyl ester carboxylesterase